MADLHFTPLDELERQPLIDDDRPYVVLCSIYCQRCISGYCCSHFVADSDGVICLPVMCCRSASTQQPKGLVVAVLFFAALSVVLAITLAVEVSARGMLGYVVTILCCILNVGVACFAWFEGKNSVQLADCVLSPLGTRYNVSGSLQFERTVGLLLVFRPSRACTMTGMVLCALRRSTVCE